MKRELEKTYVGRLLWQMQIRFLRLTVASRAQPPLSFPPPFYIMTAGMPWL